MAENTFRLENSAAAILAASPDCIMVISAAGIVKFVNARGLELMEMTSPAELCGTYYADAWPAELRQGVIDAISGAAAGRSTTVEGYRPTAAGAPRWWETRFSAVWDPALEEAEIIGITRDISVRRQRELELRAREHRLAALVESSSDGICEAGSDGRCTFINSTGAAMLGYDPAELLGRALHDILHASSPDPTGHGVEDCPIRAAIATGVAQRITDELVFRRDGYAIPMSYFIFPARTGIDQGGVVVTFNDAAERRQVESDMRNMASRLSDADRRTNEFIATLAHELRNPLAPIRTGLQLMRKAGDNAPGMGRVREMMERQLGHMVHLITDLLDIARVTSGKMELKRERVGLQQVIETAVEASSPLISSANHSLSIDIPHEPLYVDGDATRLAQVFTNILNNAARYTAAGGNISLQVRRSEGTVRIVIADDGIGIAPDMLGAIFEMFTKIGHAQQDVQGGLGIGLNLVRRLVQLHGGEVIARSDGLRRGSQFVVALPVAVPSAEYWNAAELEPPVPVAVPQPGIKVLLVDDNVDAAASLSMLLQLGEHTTQVANSGAEALRLVAEFKPDIVFLDIGMPGMSGYEVARAIRRMPQVGSPVLVALTGWGGEADRALSKNAGFDEHLTKPADISVIEKLLSKFEPPVA